MTIEGMRWQLLNGQKVYYLEGFSSNATIRTTSKRKNPSPLDQPLRQTPKRPLPFKVLLYDEDKTPHKTKQQAPKPHPQQNHIPQTRNLPEFSRTITNRGQPLQNFTSNANRSKVTSTAVKTRKVPEEMARKPVSILRRNARIFVLIFATVFTRL